LLLHNFRRKFHPGSTAWKATPLLTFSSGVILGCNLYSLTICTILIHLLNVQVWNLKRNAKIIFLHCTVNCALFLFVAHKNLDVYAVVLAIMLALTTLTQVYQPLKAILIEYFGIFLASSVFLYSTPRLANTDKVLFILSLVSLLLICVFTIKRKMFYIDSNRILYSAIFLLSFLLYLHSSLGVFLTLSMTFANAISATLGEVRR
jgi:hypothetical protein